MAREKAPSPQVLLGFEEELALRGDVQGASRGGQAVGRKPAVRAATERNRTLKKVRDAVSSRVNGTVRKIGRRAQTVIQCANIAGLRPPINLGNRTLHKRTT